MAIAGTVSFVPKGEYNAQTTYKRLNTVRYQNKVYVSLKTVVGVTPSDDKVNWMLFVDTTEIDPSEIAPEFSVAANRENIMTGESLPTLFGKIKKYFTDLKGHAFNDTVNNLTTSTTGSALDASQGNVLQEEIDDINSNLVEQKMLGWTVPSECPIQNEVNGNQFVQKVGRVDLGSLSNVGESYFTSTDIKDLIKKPSNNTTVANIYSYNYIAKSWSAQAQGDNSVAVEAINGTIAIALADLSQKPTGYLYYELANYNTMTIDGNEEVVEVAEDVDTLKKETTVNLLNPTLQTTTQNGVTCTNNGDGTYTLNGTASSAIYLTVGSCTLKDNEYKLLGCPSTGGYEKYVLYLSDTMQSDTTDTGNGVILQKEATSYLIKIGIWSGITLNNVIFKPMITTNLNATYDDFVSYTGDTGKLNSDVASLLKRIETLESLVNKTDTTVTE